MTQDDEIRRGNEAARIMAEPMLVQAFEAMERGIVEQMRRTDLRDADTLRTLTASLQAMHGVRNHLLQTMATGKMAAIAKEESKVSRALKRVFT